MYSDADFSSCSDPDAQGNDSLDDFEITDHYVDDEPLDHFLLDPQGLNLIDPFAALPNDNDTVHDGDPEPSPGPFDPG